MRNVRSARCVLAAGIVGVSFFAGGCASIVHSGNRSISISTDPPGATASIRKVGGAAIEDVVVVNKTPCTVALDPRGGYFRGQSYTLRLELPGYQTAEVALTPKMSGWYWGNIIFGGLIGMLAVDPSTGAMWNIAPDKVEQKLPARSALIKNKTGFFVVLASELTPAEREHMVRLN